MKSRTNMHGVQATARRIRAFLKDTEHSVYVDTDNRLIDVVYFDFIPVEDADRAIQCLNSSAFRICVQRELSERVIKDTLYEMYRNYSVTGFDRAFPERGLMTLAAMVHSRLAGVRVKGKKVGVSYT